MGESRARGESNSTSSHIRRRGSGKMWQRIGEWNNCWSRNELGRVCCLWSSFSSAGVESQQIRQLSIGLDQLLENVSCWRYRESEPGILPGGQARDDVGAWFLRHQRESWRYLGTCTLSQVMPGVKRWEDRKGTSK